MKTDNNAMKSAHPMNKLCTRFAFLIALAGFVSAQEKGPDLHGGDPSQKELIELFGKVENRLREIDRLLSDAGAGDTRALKDVGPAGIDELLKKSRQSGEQALQDIDRILEIARQMGQQSQSQGQGQPSQGQGEGDGKNPLDGQGQTTTQREQTPGAPEQKDKSGQKDKKPGGEKPDGEKPDSQGKKPKDPTKPDGESNPKDPKASKQSPKNQESGPPPGSALDKSGASSDTRDRWGDLPQHARDVFRSEGGHDMPVQYRDWIDAYYRRLNQKQP